jgi:hypothetical protein
VAPGPKAAMVGLGGSPGRKSLDDLPKLCVHHLSAASLPHLAPEDLLPHCRVAARSVSQQRDFTVEHLAHVVGNGLSVYRREHFQPIFGLLLG